MRQCISGSGANTTSNVISYLAGTVNPLIRHLYMIGEPYGPQTIYLTDHEAPVLYNYVGATFYPAVVKKDGITAKVGLDILNTTITWSPSNQTFTSNTSTAAPIQLARLHYYDNWPVRIWRCFMPTPGDANTLGACEWFGGRIANTNIGRNQIVFTVNSFLDVVSQQLPANVIESTSTLAGYTATSFVSGDSSIPIFLTYAGSTVNSIVADCQTPTYHKIYSANTFNSGYLQFLSGTGATLAGVWSAIGLNTEYTDGDGNTHSLFNIYTPLPYPPTPGVDKFFVTKSAPLNVDDGAPYYGFPYVPSPTVAA